MMSHVIISLIGRIQENVRFTKAIRL